LHRDRIEVIKAILTITPGTRMRAALILAIVADIFQIVRLPFIPGSAASPVDDVLDIAFRCA